MDVLSPELYWIKGRCYRLPTQKTNSAKQNFQSYDLESKHKSYFSDECDDFQRLKETVEELPNNRYKLSLQVPQAFWSKIIGTKGVTKKRIENDTKTTIIIPKLMEQGDIIVKGSSEKSIILAKKNIDAIVESARQKLVFTHFVSIPMTNNKIKTNFLYFKEQVLKLYGSDSGVDESIFQNPDKLHLTICTLILTDQYERNMAENILKEVCENTVKPLFMNNLCKLEMKGIEYMNDDPAEVDVLYAKVYSENEKELLQKISNIILKTFNDYKLSKSDNTENVKLHVTLMNTLFRHEEINELDEKNLSKNKKHTKKSRKTFNAVNILQAFQDYYFGEEDLKNIQLSVRFSTGKDGFYKSTCIINL